MARTKQTARRTKQVRRRTREIRQGRLAGLGAIPSIPTYAWAIAAGLGAWLLLRR